VLQHRNAVDLKQEDVVRSLLVVLKVSLMNLSANPIFEADDDG
jgi:hypothetical protein